MKILADLKYYNANTRDARVGDCVKRALAVAFRMDYDKVSAELNAIKRSMNRSQYNVRPVFGKFLSTRGVTFIRLSEPWPSVDEFSKQYPVGTYLCLTGNEKHSSIGITDHLLCIVDGTVYDSWNSLNERVIEYAVVRSDPNEGEDESTLDDIFDALSDYIDSYCQLLSAKCLPYCEVIYWPKGNERDNKYTRSIEIACKPLMDTDMDWRLSSVYYRKNELIGHDIMIKYNPRMTQVDNLQSLKTKVKQKIYDWVYIIRKDLKDIEGAKSVVRHRQFHGHTTDLMQLPEWSRSLVTYFRTDGNPEYEDKFEVNMEALPDDPRASESPDVTFAADTLRELKDQMADYKERYLRFGYDY